MKEEKQISKAWGISSLICGIASILLFLAPYFGLPLAILALVFRAKDKENGIATAGYVIGIIGIVINSVMLLFVVIMLLFMSALGSL